MLPFLIGIHREAKWLLKILAFCLKSDTSSTLTRIGGMIWISSLLKKFFMMDQYVFGTLLGLSNFAIYLSFDSLVGVAYSCD